jgi:hypothetical protein
MKVKLLPLYDLERFCDDPESMASRVVYLLERDRFLSPPDNYEVCYVMNQAIDLEILTSTV